MTRRFCLVLGLSLVSVGGVWGQPQRAESLPSPQRAPVSPGAATPGGSVSEHGAPAWYDVPTFCGACQASPPPQYYVRLDYLMWWIRGGSVPTLVTTAPETSPAAGTLDDPNTRVLFGGELDYGTFSGARFAAGISPGDGTWGFEIGGFLLQQRDFQFGAASNDRGFPLITRPFFDNFNNIESAYDVASEDRFKGRIDIEGRTELWGYEANVMFHPAWTPTGPRHDLFVGFRALGLDENLMIHARLQALDAGVLVFQNRGVDPPNGQGTIDVFDTRNRFYGPQVGSRFNWERGPLGLTLAAKVALGVNRQTVEILGQSQLTDRDGVVTERALGGVLAQRTNIGRYGRNEFALLPELGVQAHYDILSWLRASVGYNVLYCTSVIRPGDAIDRTIDIRQVPIDPSFNAGAATQARRPDFSFRDSDFWAHGLNFGLEVRY
jgi:hypothetical protein